MRALTYSFALALVLPFAASDAQAQSLSDILKNVQSARAEEQRQNQAREAEFRRQVSEQDKLLASAVAKRNAAEAESKRLSDAYDANEVQINNLNELLRQRQGNLGELFGVTRQIAGEVANSLTESVTNTQYPPAQGQEARGDFLRRLAGAKSLPSITELERMWFEVQREITAGGEVAKYTTSVVKPDSESEDMEIVRIGPFTSSAEDQFLVYRDGALRVLPRQLSGHARGLAEDLASAQGEEYVPAVIDPARGVLLELVTERPSWVQRFAESEWIVKFILVVGAIGLVLAAVQTSFLLGERGRVQRQLARVAEPSNDNSLGRVLGAFRGDPNRIEEDAEVAELRISEAVLREVPKLERFQAFLRLAVAAGPLLGLVGTVVGMIITFQSITETGSSDPRIMAHGIGTAMIATVAGLGIAIPLLFWNAFLTSMSRSIVQVLDEQSTGLLAESLEKRRG